MENDKYCCLCKHCKYPLDSLNPTCEFYRNKIDKWFQLAPITCIYMDFYEDKRISNDGE